MEKRHGFMSAFFFILNSGNGKQNHFSIFICFYLRWFFTHIEDWDMLNNILLPKCCLNTHVFSLKDWHRLLFKGPRFLPLKWEEIVVKLPMFFLLKVDIEFCLNAHEVTFKLMIVLLWMTTVLKFKMDCVMPKFAHVFIFSIHPISCCESTTFSFKNLFVFYYWRPAKLPFKRMV